MGDRSTFVILSVWRIQSRNLLNTLTKAGLFNFYIINEESTGHSHWLLLITWWLPWKCAHNESDLLIRLLRYPPCVQESLTSRSTWALSCSQVFYSSIFHHLNVKRMTRKLTISAFCKSRSVILAHFPIAICPCCMSEAQNIALSCFSFHHSA